MFREKKLLFGSHNFLCTKIITSSTQEPGCKKGFLQMFSKKNIWVLQKNRLHTPWRKKFALGLGVVCHQDVKEGTKTTNVAHVCWFLCANSDANRERTLLWKMHESSEHWWSQQNGCAETVSLYHSVISLLCQGLDGGEEDIDWWSKYYASTGELDKCRMYLEKGYDKLQVTF